MTRRVALALGAAVCLVAAGCGDDASKPAVVGGSIDVPRVCAIVQAWSDQSVDVVNGFSRRSPDADPSQRRTLYLASIDGLDHLYRELRARLPAGAGAAAPRLDRALADMRTNLDQVEADSAALPAQAFSIASVQDGRLFTGLEKNQAIVFQALADLADEGIVPRGCGRRAALDLGPSATFPG